MAIDPKRVLLVRNSNAAWSSLSASVSDWYASARGLAEQNAADYHWVSFDFGDGSKNTATKRMTDYTGVANPNFGNVVIGPGNGLQNTTIDDGSVVVTGISSKTTAATLGQALLPALSAIYITHKIECVLVLPGVPQYLWGPFDKGAEVIFPQDIELFLAVATAANSVSSNSRKVRALMQPRGGVVSGTLTGPLPAAAQAGQFNSAAMRRQPLRRLGDWSSGGPLPCGRVGWALGSTSFSTLAEVQTIVNNALSVESQNNKGKKVVVGGTAYIFGGGVVNTMSANYAARDFGLTNYGYVSGSSGGPGTNEQLLWAAKPAWAGSALAVASGGGTTSVFDSDGTTLISGTTDSRRILGPSNTQLDTWGLMVSIVAPNISDPVESNDITWQAGGYAYSWMSTSGAIRLFSLKKGASLAWGTAGEPFGSNIGDVDSLFVNLLYGLSGAEAAYRSVCSTVGGTGFSFGQNKYTVAWGDPLYAPYKLNAAAVLQVG